MNKIVLVYTANWMLMLAWVDVPKYVFIALFALSTAYYDAAPAAANNK